MQSLTEIVAQINEAVKIAANTPHEPEKKLRELVSPIWQTFLKEKRVGLNLQIREELTLANGRADTVFNRLILEYKKPYAIKPDNNKNRQLITQVQGYILDVAKKERFSKERLLGVAFDGDHFLFMRYIKRWIADEPIALTESSLEIFLKNLEKLTSKAALIPENLIRDFAVGKESRNKVAVDCIKAFYHELNQHGKEGETKEHVFFDQWKVQFAEVHGSLEQKKIDKETLFTSYGFSKSEQKDFNVLAFFFALDSYYALLMKLLSYQVVGYYTLSKLTGLPLHDWETLASEDLKNKCNELEEGGIFRSIGIRNFLEGDLFSWYIEAWNDHIYRAVQQVVKYLNDYDPETMEIAPDETRDILKKLYQYLVPRQIRHDLGEYYTPDWLAERCLNQAGYGIKVRDLLEKRLLDPGCGSGTFLILAIKRAREHAKNKEIDAGETLRLITRNIMGFDLNPLAVIAARTNYMLAIADLLKHKKGEITIPVYLCDSINPPSAKERTDLLDLEAGNYPIRTSVGLFRFPGILVNKDLLQKVTVLLEDAVKKKQSKQKFIENIHQELGIDERERPKCDELLGGTYTKLLELEEKGINGVWARIIKNAFAPLFVGKFDLIVGNPPWVNWESLPQEYREVTAPLWKRYDLFEHTGLRARLGSAKDDISVLMTYVAIDRYLSNGGKLCFVITQTLFKTVGGGEGFRRFCLGKKGTPFKVLQVDDMVELQPFDSATNKTSVFFCQKGVETTYPVEYHLWKKKSKGSIEIDMAWDEVVEKTRVKYLKAQSIDGSLQGPWITAKPRVFKALKNVIGESVYQGRAGCCGWLNSVYLVEIVENNEGVVKIRNFTAHAKKEVAEVDAFVEAKQVYPTLRGREIRRWKASPELGIVVAQDSDKPSKGIALDIMEKKFPRTLKYFTMFKNNLDGRNGYKKYLKGEPFYSMYNFGPYTFAPYKVVWTRVGTDLKSAVVGGHRSRLFDNQIVVPIETVVFVPFKEPSESHFFCAMLNSTVSRVVIASYSNKGTGSFGSPHILKNVKIPKYDKANETHRELAHLSEECHSEVDAGIDVKEIEEQIDGLAGELWGLSKDELEEIKDSFEELK